MIPHDVLGIPSHQPGVGDDIHQKSTSLLKIHTTFLGLVHRLPAVHGKVDLFGDLLKDLLVSSGKCFNNVSYALFDECNNVGDGDVGNDMGGVDALDFVFFNKSF